MTTKLNSRELATVLAALRYWQTTQDDPKGYSPEHFEDDEPLDDNEIDALCERLNVAEKPEKPDAPTLEALMAVWELMSHPHVRWMITDGGKGHLGEAAKYHHADKLRREVVQATGVQL